MSWYGNADLKSNFAIFFLKFKQTFFLCNSNNNNNNIVSPLSGLALCHQTFGNILAYNITRKNVIMGIV